MKLTISNLALFTMISIASANCTEDVEAPVVISGTWVEAVHQNDTLVFDWIEGLSQSGLPTLEDEDWARSFILRRGSVLRATGQYTYDISQGSIVLKWLLSSTIGADGTPYFFERDNVAGQIRIGNFYVDSLSSTEVLTFTSID